MRHYGPFNSQSQKETFGNEKRPIVLHTQFGIGDRMYYGFHMSQPTKCIINDKLLLREICTVAWVFYLKEKVILFIFVLNLASVLLLDVLGAS